MKRLGLPISLIMIASLLAACATPTPEVIEKVVTKEVEKVITKEVEKIVTQVVKEIVKETVIVEGTPQVVEKEVTKIVEKVITATPEPVDTSKYGGTLIIQTSALKQFDPIYMTDDPSFEVISNVFSFLFRRQGNGDPYPDLATHWEYEDDTTIIFHLRQGVMWHDDNAVFPKGASRQVVADDVVYTIKRAVETEDTTESPDFVASYESVEAMDDYTVKLTLKTPNALLFAHARGLTDLGIVPHEAIEQLGEDFGMNPVGSGPFKFVEYKPDESLTLVRNDLYWKKPFLAQVVFKIIPDQETALIALETGEVDIIHSVPQVEFERLNADNRFTLHAGGTSTAVQMMFNMNHPLFGQEKFRQAVAYALDGDAINANVYGPMHVSGCGTAGPGVPGYDPNLCNKYFPYDPEGAQALLEELGWQDTDGDGVLDKDGQPMEFPLEIWSSDPMPQFGAAIVTQLQEIGIPVELQTVEFGTFVGDWRGGAEKAFMMSGWGGDGGLNGLWNFSRVLGYDDPEVYDLLDQASAIVETGERDEVLREAQDKIYGQYWAVPLGFHLGYSASRSWVHDFYGPSWWLNLCTEQNNIWVTK